MAYIMTLKHEKLINEQKYHNGLNLQETREQNKREGGFCFVARFQDSDNGNGYEKQYEVAGN